MKTRAEFVACVRELEADCLGVSESSFNNVVEQLKVKNPGFEFVTEGIGYLNTVMDGYVPKVLANDEGEKEMDIIIKESVKED